MELLGKKVFKKYSKRHAQARRLLEAWVRVVENTTWETPAEVLATFPSTDTYKKITIFDIGGDRYRLLAKIDYDSGILLVRELMTHEVYSKNRWKRNI